MTPGGATHPMGERERMALFNMISAHLPGAKVLDAYAGSGALGIEALSRGAESCTFVERASGAAKTVRENLTKLEIPSDEAEVCQQTVARFETTETFDLILADPPYDNFRLDEIEHLVQFLRVGGVLVLSHPNTIDSVKGLSLLKTRQYARAHISIFTK